MKKIKSPVDLDHSFKDIKIVLKADKWAVFDDFHADEMKRIFPFIEIAPADESDIKEISKSQKKRKSQRRKERQKLRKR